MFRKKFDRVIEIVTEEHTFARNKYTQYTKLAEEARESGFQSRYDIYFRYAEECWQQAIALQDLKKRLLRELG